MNPKCAGHRRLRPISVCSIILLVLALSLFARTAPAQTPGADTKPADAKSDQPVYQTFYLAYATDRNSLNDIQTDLRNMIPRAKIFGVESENAITMRGTADDIAMAQKLIADLDKPRKVYRLTYTITDSGDSQAKDAQHLTLIVASGEKTTFKQGTRVPIVVGNTGKDEPQGWNVQYVDVGLNIYATLTTSADALTLSSKVELSSLGSQTTGADPHDPVFPQTVLDGTSTLVPGKPFILDSLDIPSTSRHEEIQVVAELVR